VFRTILVPLDGSLSAELALPTAIALAKRAQGRLEIVFAHESVAMGSFEDWPWTMSSATVKSHYLTAKARQLRESSGVPVTHTVLSGDAGDSICAHARSSNADLIAMVTHGRTGLARTLYGSVTDHVVRNSGIPVLHMQDCVVHAPRRGPPDDFPRILVPIDESAESRQIFDAAGALARRGVSQLLLVRVVAPVRTVLDATFAYGYMSGPIDDAATSEVVDDADHELMNAAVDLGQRSGCDVDPHVLVSDHPANAIVDFARKYNASTIAMTTHGRGVPRMVYGSVADRVMRDSHLPMLVLRPALVAAEVATEPAAAG